MDLDRPISRLKRSFLASAADIVFGMKDGAVSIFGLVFGVAATTSNGGSILIPGALGPAAAAVSMMAGAFLQAETSRDLDARRRAQSLSGIAADPSQIVAGLPGKLALAGLDPAATSARVGAVRRDEAAILALAALMRAPSDESEQNPLEQSLWMLVADFFSAAVPILPFAFAPVTEARYVLSAVAFALLVALGAGRASVAGRGYLRKIAETFTIGLVAWMAGVGISLFVSHVVWNA